MVMTATSAFEESFEDDDEVLRPLVTRKGWRQFVGRPVVPPVLLSLRDWEALDDEARMSYDDRRLDYHGELVVVRTAVVEKVALEGRRLTRLNRRARGARRGLIVSGDGGTGKSTAITYLGKTFELMSRQQDFGASHIPVVYVTVPMAATPRMLAAEFARFLGIPVVRRANITDVMESVCGVLEDARTGLVLVDEIHNMDLNTRRGAEVSDTLKYFSERIAATFVYAGINLESEGLFSGTRGQQIGSRFKLITTGAFPYHDEWKGLVATLEAALRLHRHKPGTLVALDEYLHQRTGGMIGSLFSLIQTAAMEAIDDGTEMIKKTALDGLQLDRTAESQRRPKASQRS
ncbi:TniB family NTP-binding protein [Nonomuraea polychroma]|uniref:TniB family NTP-binding protein n=1 Tax=Nonomuraea polychroma TaxID=46176 RepID=UPI003D8E4B99